MKFHSLITLLVPASHALSVPLAAGARLQVGSAVFFESPDSNQGSPAHLLHDRDAARNRRERTTSMPLNPPRPTRTTTRSPTTTTTTRPSTTTTRVPTTTTRTTTTTRVPTTTTRTTTTTTRAPTTTTAGPKPVQTLNVSGMTYINAMLLSHNVHRPNHTENNLVWNTGLAATAQKIASSCVYAHDTTTDGGGYGQNIGAGAAGNAAAGLITNLMYNGEINNFPAYGVDNLDMSNFGSWGHYSQLAWAATTDVGCATVYCPGGLQNTGGGIAPYFTVCNYKPPGNYIGQFSQVKAPQGGNTWVVVGS